MILLNSFEAPIELEDLVRIERLAYPPQFREMQYFESWKDVADYSEVPLRKLVVLSDGRTWYAIIARHGFGRAEFVDLAKVPGTPSLDWFFIINAIRSIGIRRLYGDAREGTSYRRFMQQIATFQSAGVKVVKDRIFEDERGEQMHELVVKI